MPAAIRVHFVVIPTTYTRHDFIWFCGWPISPGNIWWIYAAFHPKHLWCLIFPQPTRVRRVSAISRTSSADVTSRLIPSKTAAHQNSLLLALSRTLPHNQGKFSLRTYAYLQVFVKEIIKVNFLSSSS